MTYPRDMNPIRPFLSPHRSTAASRYQYSWPDAKSVLRTSSIPAHIRPYVDALGIEGAVRFILEFGGAPIHISTKPIHTGSAAKFLGVEATVRLATELCQGHSGYIRVPIATRFVARVMKANGVQLFVIARTLRRTDATIRGFLLSDEEFNARFSGAKARLAALDGDE